MNRKMVLSTIGKILILEAILMLLPVITCIIYSEFGPLIAFLKTIAIAILLGGGLVALNRTKHQVIYAKEGFAIVGLAWIMMSVIGCLPFVLSGEIPNFIDAFFETVSGFTTTGASIVNNVETLSHGILFWRSFTHWVGGMGVLVFIMALIPKLSDRAIHIMRAEMPGPVVDKVLPRIKSTAKILYLIYVVLTAVLTLFLIIGGMPVFESILHAFGTAGTGGFGVKADSYASYSPYLQWVTTIGMLCFGINFNIYFLILIKKIKSVFKSQELLIYFAIVFVSVGSIALNILPQYSGFNEALRHAGFQVASVISTTGYVTTDFNLWPTFSKVMLLALMVIGGCAGSTAGGLKVSRVVLLFKNITKEFKKLLHPHSVNIIKSDGKQLNTSVIHGVSAYFAVYCFCFIGIFVLLSLDKYGIETNLSAVTACFNNIGPGLADVGPASTYAGYSVFSKLLLSFAMLLGRLEIFPLLIAISPSVWLKK